MIFANEVRMDDLLWLPAPAGAFRCMAPYDDFDGISVIADHESLLARYRDHDLGDDPMKSSIALHPTRTLLSLANAREALSWGTHQLPARALAVVSTVPFDASEREANGMRSSLDVGVIALRGPLVIAAWHSLTFGCDYRHGNVEAPRMDVPLGTYRVTVHRPFAVDEEALHAEHTTFLVELARVEDDARVELTEVPGADGWF